MREVAGIVVSSFSRQHFDICSSKVYWNGIYLYKSSKKKKKNTASIEDFKCVDFHDDLIFPPEGSALNLLLLSFYWYYNGIWYTLIQKLKCLFISYVSRKPNQEWILPLPKLQSYKMIIALKRNKQVWDEGALLKRGSLSRFPSRIVWMIPSCRKEPWEVCSHCSCLWVTLPRCLQTSSVTLTAV